MLLLLLLLLQLVTLQQRTQVWRMEGSARATPRKQAIQTTTTTTTTTDSRSGLMQQRRVTPSRTTQPATQPATTQTPHSNTAPTSQQQPLRS
jgi:hypothetical protein